MPCHRRLAAAVWIIVAAAAWEPASAQSVPQPGLNGASAADCERLASIPNPPMSVATCKSLLQMSSGMQGAAAPQAQRPGDEAMTCEQIFAEMSAASGGFAATPEAAKTSDSLNEFNAMRAKHAAENAALQAQGETAIAASAAVDMASGGLTRGAASRAAGMQFEAQAAAQAARQQEEARPVIGRMSDATGASARYGAQAMQANPRAARLGQLAVEKNCRAPGS